MELNKKNIRKIQGLILFTVIAVVVGVNYKGVIGIFGGFFKIIFPFLLGAAMAFILNVPMRKIEKLIKLKDGSKIRRPLCLLLTIFFVVGILLLVVFVVVPQVIDTLTGLQDSIPAFIQRVQIKAEELFYQYPDILAFINTIEFSWKEIIQAVIGFLSVGASSVLSGTVSAAISVVSGVTTFGIALIFSIYILLQKENLNRQIRKFLYAFLPTSMADGILSIGSLTERIFSSFLTGQCVEAVILGTMFFIVLSIFRLPYAVLIGVLIAFTALIPVFGAFIGCGVGIFLMLLISPAKAIQFVIIFLILQQLEGNLIYPYVVGNSVGLPSIWVLVAVTLGGSMMGVTGMLIFIPLCSVLYTILRSIVNRKLEEKKLKQ